jgi:hypothetical protein
MRPALAGDLSHRHGTAADGEKKLMVVSSFEEPAVGAKLEGRVAKVLHEYGVQMVAEREVSAFLVHVAKVAHRVVKHPSLGGISAPPMLCRGMESVLIGQSQ